MTSDNIIDNSEERNESQPVVKTAPSEGLAAYVVAYRVLGIGKELAISCMEELSSRRSRGDHFDFESYIEKHIANIPKPVPLDIKGMSSILNIRNLSQLIRKE